MIPQEADQTHIEYGFPVSKRDRKRRNLLKISISLPSSGWIFQKVLAETVQKDLILSQKALISNRRNLGLFAPTSMRFPSKDSKSNDLSF